MENPLRILFSECCDDIIEHLEGLLAPKPEVQEQPKSIKISKNEKHYDRIIESFSQLNEIYEKMFTDRHNGLPHCEYPETNDVDQFKICTEIDQFKIKYPDTYPKYLHQLLIEYATLMFSKNEFISDYLPEYGNEFIDPWGYGKLFTSIDYIVDHLKDIFKIEDVRDISKLINGVKTVEKDQKIPNPKGRTVLTREQTTLLFWYLREKKLIAQPTNENIAHSVTILTGYSKKQIQDIIKSSGTPVYLLGKDNDKVTRNDFRTVISELETLIETIKKDFKTYSDNMELK